MRIALRVPVVVALAAGLVVSACTSASTSGPSPAASVPATSTPQKTPRLGSIDHPLILAFVPSQETQKVLKSGDTIASALSQITGLKFKAQVPASYAATIEAMCSGKVDVAFLTPLSYVLARSKGCAEYMTTSVRFGSPTYRGQIRVRADSGITDLAGLKGKRFAFSDPVSTSGAMYPQLLVKKQFNMTAKEFFSQMVYAGGHDLAMIQLYKGAVDGAASFIDGRTDVPGSAVKLYPDIVEKTKRIAETEDIPGDPQVVRKDLPADLKAQIKKALLDYSKTDAGKAALKSLYSIDGLAEIPEKTYDGIAEGAKVVGIDLEKDAAITPKPAATPAPSPSKAP